VDDKDLADDVRSFVDSNPGFLDVESVYRAAQVAKYTRHYDEVCNGKRPDGDNLTPPLNQDEKDALVREKTKIFSEKGMRYIFITVSLAAFLQGFVQSSIAGANVYEGYWRRVSASERYDHEMGITNAIVYLSAALM
jgi:hypothetical protein